MKKTTRSSLAKDLKRSGDWISGAIAVLGKMVNTVDGVEEISNEAESIIRSASAMDRMVQRKRGRRKSINNH